ncbi:MAG TPA: glycosyltransferase family 2 protein [Tepidisphaeraceae bacterium]|nr:glycosyltransferase family 2 protein [Tepidisphaeraceae bacterium]
MGESLSQLAAAAASDMFPADMDLTLTSRRPARLPSATIEIVAAAPVPSSDRPAAEPPDVSVVVVTYNNLLFTKLCLGSLIRHTSEPPFEVIVVDNGSTDGTREYLCAVAEANPNVEVVLNRNNRGFAAANNQGLALAKGRTLILLNNDTVLPQGWMSRLVAHVEDPTVGLVGPVTNRIGNEAEIEVTYRDYGGMLRFAEERARAEAGRSFDIPMPAMFCLAMRRDVYERIGPLDERFEVGLLEDDDYARRARDAGYRLVCAEDVFVHHFGQASFGELVPTGDYMRLLKANQRRYEEKWGEPWKPYRRRTSRRYARLVPRLKDMLARHVPAGSTVLVASRGDDDLLRLNDVTAWHFPRLPDGTYAGCYPADSAAAVQHLEESTAAGAQYLLLPQTAAWWLDYYAGFARHLAQRCRVVDRSEGVGVLFDLTRSMA